MLQMRVRSRIPRFPDIGRVGRVVSNSNELLLVVFFQDDLVGVTTYCRIPLCFWSPVPDFLVEPYEARARKFGWRLTDKAQSLFDVLGWPYTQASRGLSELPSNEHPQPPLST